MVDIRIPARFLYSWNPEDQDPHDTVSLSEARTSYILGYLKILHTAPLDGTCIVKDQRFTETIEDKYQQLGWRTLKMDQTPYFLVANDGENYLMFHPEFTDKSLKGEVYKAWESFKKRFKKR